MKNMDKHWYTVEAVTAPTHNQLTMFCRTRYVKASSEKEATDLAIAAITKDTGRNGWQPSRVIRAVREYSNVQFFNWTGTLGVSMRLESKLTLGKSFPVVAFSDSVNGSQPHYWVVQVRSKNEELTSSVVLVTSYSDTLPSEVPDGHTSSNKGRTWKIRGHVTVPEGEKAKHYVQKVIRAEMSKYMQEQIDVIACAMNQL